VGNSLTFEAEVELAKDQVANQNCNDDGNEAVYQVELLEHDAVTDTTGHAEAAALCKSTNYQTCDEGDGERSTHGAGALGAEYEPSGNEDGQSGYYAKENGVDCAFKALLCIGTLEGEALLESDGTNKDTCDEANQTYDGVEVAAADTDNHAEGAAQEYQSADHNYHTQQEAGNGGRTANGLPFLLAKGHDHGTQSDTGDLRTYILYNCCAVKLYSAGDVSEEAGDAEAHVCGVAQHGQYYCCNTDYEASDDYRKMLFHN